MRPDEVPALLEQPIEDPEVLLGALLAALADGNYANELWQALQDAVVRDGKQSALSSAYDAVTAPGGIDLLPPDAQAWVLLMAVRAKRATREYAQAFAFAQRALELEPGRGYRRRVQEELLELFDRSLRDKGRALDYAEALLATEPEHARAREVAESCLEVRALAPRAAAILAALHETAQRLPLAAAMYAKELGSARGERRVWLQRRLAVLRQDVLNDPAGALKLLAPVVAADPADDEMRERFVKLSLAFDQAKTAARVLLRALVPSVEPALRTRIGVQLGQVLLRAGEIRRAQGAFEQALGIAGDTSAVLVAARELSELHATAGRQAAVARSLAFVVKLEENKNARLEAARRLARVCEGESLDSRRAAQGWLVLLDSPWFDEALAHLESLAAVEPVRSSVIEGIDAIAETLPLPEQVRAALTLIARLRAAGRDISGAIDTWQKLIQRFPDDRNAFGELISLCERERCWESLGRALEADVELAADEEKAQLLARLGSVQQWHLDDPKGAVESFQRALKAEPEQVAARQGLERQLVSPLGRLEAAIALEQYYRSRGAHADLARVIEARAEAETEPARRLEAYAEAAELAATVLGHPRRALALAGRALREAVRGARESIPAWVGRLEDYAQRATDLGARADLLRRALGQATVDCSELVVLARATASALSAVGDQSSAVAVIEQVLQAGVNTELEAELESLKALPPLEERCLLLASEVEREPDSRAKRSLLHTLAHLQAHADPTGATALGSWQLALQLDPSDWVAHQACLQAWTQAGQSAEAQQELERALGSVSGELKALVQMQLADLLLRQGKLETALTHYRELLGTTTVPEEVWSAVERLAAEQKDCRLVVDILERRITNTVEPPVRAGLLARLGDVLGDQLEAEELAVARWLEAARLFEGDANDAPQAARLYARVLAALPGQQTAREHLLEIWARCGSWQELRVPLQEWLESADRAAAVTWLLSLEPLARNSGALEVYADLVETLVAHCADARLAADLRSSVARVLATDAGFDQRVIQTYRELLDAETPVDAVELDYERFLDTRPNLDRRVNELRWLMQRRTDRAKKDVAPLLLWAEMEYIEFKSLPQAIELYESVLTLDAERVDVLLILQALHDETGNAEKALSVVSALRDQSEGELRIDAEIARAALLIERLDRPVEALEVIEPLVRVAKVAPEALRIVHLGLSHEASRQHAAALLERATEAEDDPSARAEVLQLLLETSASLPGFEDARARWYLRLIDCSGDDPNRALDTALRAAEELPGRMELWERAEKYAREIGTPQPVAEAYKRALHDDLPVAIAEPIGRRMVDFHEEWFNEPQLVVELLQRVLELAPGASWAFDRLKLEFNASQRWDELFHLYDRAISQAESETAQAELLREVAMAAKDFAGDADRAIQYLVRLHVLVPTDSRVESALERLYERGGHAEPLIELLARRIEGSDARATRRLKIRIAGLRLDVDQPLDALVLLEELLEPADARDELAELLERLVALDSARESMVSVSSGRKNAKSRKTRAISVREQAANHLRDYYQTEGRTPDVVRMLEVLVEVASDPSERAKRLRRTVDVRLERLQDRAGAFLDMLRLVALEPEVRTHRELLGELAGQTNGHEQQAELLVKLGDSSADTRLQVHLLSEAATVLQSALQQIEPAIELFLRVLAMAEHDEETALAAARALDGLLEQTGRYRERCSVLERLAALETQSDARRGALGEAARVAFVLLNDPARAVTNWEARLKDDAEDLEALDGLIEALGRAERWSELVAALRVRAKLLKVADSARTDRVRIARVLADQMHARKEAIAAWMHVREVHGRDEESFAALRDLLYTEQRWPELADLLNHEAQADPGAQRQAELRRELGELHRTRTGDVRAALQAFVGAGDWNRAIQVVATAHADRVLGREVCSSLLELAFGAWQASADDGLDGSREAASWAIDELSTRLLEDGLHDEAVELMVRCAQFPFSSARTRQLKRDAAILYSDRLKQPKLALRLFDELLSEDPGDDIAAETVTRFASLLERQGKFSEIAALWENQARCHAERGDRGTSAALWVRAAEVWEARASDLERAIAGYEQGAALGGIAALKALARVHVGAGRPAEAAASLEQLLTRSPREQTATLALQLADIYVAAGMPAKARAALEKSVELALDASQLRKRLSELYRDARDWQQLAELLIAEAGRAADTAERIRYLRESASVHVMERGDPNSAVPLLAKAVGLAPADSDLRLALADALSMAHRFPEAVLVLREQLENYGARRPKARALVHHSLAQVLVANGERGEARVELDAANRIDPAHPAILRALARMALEDGELARAEQTYRALLLVLPPTESPRGPSRAEALLDLADIAARQNDATRAAEFEESAFEAALETAGEASCLEAALGLRGRYDLLARTLEARLESARSAAEAIVALAALARLHAEHLGGVEAIEKSVRRRANELYETLGAEAVVDENAWVALGQIFEALGDSGAEARVLEQQVEALLARGARGSSDAGPFYRLAEVQLAEASTHERGLELLRVALDLRAEPSRAAQMLSQALDAGFASEEAVALFEHVARQSGDKKLLGDALLRSVQLPGDRGESLREGVRLANEAGAESLVEQLLRAALGNEALAWSDADAAWARMRLAEMLEARGEIEESVGLQRAAVEFLPPEEQRGVLLRIAAAANEHLDEPKRAASIYEQLLELDPSDRQIWEPLLGLYRRLGETASLVRLIDQTVPVVDTLDDRCRLRVEQAHLLLDQGDEARAIQLLQETLLDDPGNVPAGELLAIVFEQQGRVDELVSLLSLQLDQAKDKRSNEEIGRLSLRIGLHLESSGRHDDALSVYRTWLDWDRESVDALRAVLRTTELGGDAYLLAEAIEDLLRVEKGEAALALSSRLASIRAEQADESGVERAWRLGFVAVPAAVELRDRLLGRYEAREEWAEMGEILEVALQHGATDASLLKRLMNVHERAGQFDQALVVFDRVAAEETENAGMRRQRAALLRELGREEEALSELENAYVLDPTDPGLLIAALERALSLSEGEGRRHLLSRLAELRMATGQRSAAKELLVTLVGEFPADADSLRQLAALAEEDGDVQTAIAVYDQLTGSEEGQSLLHAALRLADLAEQSGNLELARAGLERAFSAFPGEAQLMARLRDVYVKTGASLELAEILLRDAEQVADGEQRLRLLLEAANLLLVSEDGKVRALQVLESARALAPDNVELGVSFARALDQSGRTDEALAGLHTIVQSHRGRRVKALAPAFEEISNIQLREGFLSDSLDSLSRAFDMDLRNGPLAMRLGRLALETDNRDVALRAFRAVSMMRSGDDKAEGASSDDKAEAYFQLARMAADEGDGRKAKILVSKALAERSDHAAAADLFAKL